MTASRMFPAGGTEASTDAVSVLYLLGWFRSGSTVLAGILGQQPGWFDAGEISSLFVNGVLLGRSCGCGTRLLDCPVWGAVIEDTLGTSGVERSAREVVARQRAALKVRHLRRILAEGDRPAAAWPELVDHAEMLSAVYASVARHTGARVIVDSSKRPADAAALRLVDGVHPYWLHLVRDPRAVALSETTTKRQLDPSGPHHMPERSLRQSVSGWVRANLAAELVVRHEAGRSSMIRYEDLAHAPRTTVASLVERAGLEGSVEHFSAENEVVLSPGHTVAGNSDRFRLGPVVINDRGRWRRDLSTVARASITAATFPLLVHYGYTERPASAEQWRST